MHDGNWQHPAETYRNGVDVFRCQWLREKKERCSCVLCSVAMDFLRVAIC